jgi:hypothetical protein
VGHAFADAAIFEKGFFEGLNLPVQQKGGLMKEADKNVGHDR